MFNFVWHFQSAKQHHRRQWARFQMLLFTVSPQRASLHIFCPCCLERNCRSILKKEFLRQHVATNCNTKGVAKPIPTIFLNQSLICGNSCYFLASINYKKKTCSIFNNLRDTDHPKARLLQSIWWFLRFCISKSTY